MPSLYEELLSSLGKEASTSTSSDVIKESIESFNNEELITLANELAVLTGDKDLESMAKIIPVYSSGVPGGSIEQEIKTEQVIQNVDPVVGEIEPLVTGPGGEGDATNVTASSKSSLEEKIAEEEEDKKEEEAKEEGKEEEEEAKEEKEDKEENKEEGEELTATEVLYSILKEGASIEELIEVRAAEMVQDLIKQAEDYEVAREIVDNTAQQLAPDPMKAYEYSEQLMDKVKTVAAAKDVPMSEAAQAVSGEVMRLAGGEQKAASSTSSTSSNYSLDELESYAYTLEQEYEKLAEAIGETAEALIREQGIRQGLQDPKLFEYVSRAMEEVKTIAAKKNINLAQAAKEYLVGSTGSTSGYVEPTVLSPTQAPSPVKAPINSNVTQSPDKLFPQMVAPVDPQGVSEAVEDVVPQLKQAEVRDYLKSILKEAITKGLSIS